MGGLQNLKAMGNSRDLAELSNQTSYPEGAKHRVLIIPTKQNAWKNQPTEQFRNQGFAVMCTSLEFFAEHVKDLVNEFDILYLNQGDGVTDYTWYLDHLSRVTAQQVADALLYWRDAGNKFIYTFMNTFGKSEVKKYDIDGNVAETVDLTPELFATSIITSTIDIGTGSFEVTENSPLTKEEIIEPAFAGAKTAAKYPIRRDRLRADDVVLLENVLGEVKDVYAYWKPNVYAVAVHGGNAGEDEDASLAYKYINIGNLARLLVGNTSPIRLAMDCVHSRKVAATGYDCDDTGDMVAADVLVQAHNGRPLELGLVTSKLTAELASAYRCLGSNVRLCSHTKYHFSAAAGAYIVVTGETSVIPANRIVKLKFPYRVINLVVKIGETTLAKKDFTAVITDAEYGYDEARGILKFTATHIGATVTRNYDYLKETEEWVGSLKDLQDYGALTNDVIYLTAGEYGMHGTIQALLDNRDIICCNYDSPNVFSWVTAKQGYRGVFSPYLADYINLGFISFYEMVALLGYSQTEVQAVDGYAQQAIDNANSRKHPFIWYDHDFPYADSAGRGIHYNATVDASWKGATYEETRQKLIVGLKWFFDRLDEENVYWMARSEYHRRYRDFNKWFIYNVESDGNTHYVHLQNRGKNPMPGVTFRSSKSIVSAKLMPNVDLDITTYAGDDLVSFDVAPGEKMTVEIVTSAT